MKVVIRAKSEWQKHDCLFCMHDAVFEAYATDIVQPIIAIRCCNKEDCKALAVVVAYSFERAKLDMASLPDKDVQALDTAIAHNAELCRQNAELRSQIAVLTAQSRERDGPL